jgi:hypothetical protein
MVFQQPGSLASVVDVTSDVCLLFFLFHNHGTTFPYYLSWPQMVRLLGDGFEIKQNP